MSGGQAANISTVENVANRAREIFREWVAWGRRSRQNKALFVLSTGTAAIVTIVFGWAMILPDPGNFIRYLALYWVWGLCAIGLVFGMAEYRTSPLRKGRERGHLLILLYLGALLIITRALNMLLYQGL